MALNRLSSSTSENTEEACLNSANRLIRLSRLSYPPISSIQDMKSTFFVQLFEQICGMQVPDLLMMPGTDTEEAHNVQAVIDTLSMDVLDLSLAHIAGEDVVAGNIEAVGNLLEVLESYLVYAADSNEEFQVKYETAEPTIEDQPIKSQICRLCGYDPETNTYNYEPTENGVCPVCYFDNAELDDDDQSSSNQVEEEPSPKTVVSVTEDDQAWNIRVSDMKHTMADPRDNIENVEPAATRGKRRGSSLNISMSEDNVELSMSTAPLTDTKSSSSTELLTSMNSLFKMLETAKEKTAKKLEAARELNKKIPEIKIDVPSDKRQGKIEGDIRLPEVSAPDGAAVEVGNRPGERPLTPIDIVVRTENMRPELPIHADEEDIAVLYEKNMVKRLASFLDETHHIQQAAQIKRAYLQKLKPYRRKIGSPYRKPKPCSFFQKDTSIATPRKCRMRTGPKSPAPRPVVAQSPLPGEKGLIKELTEKFPGIRISPSTVRQMASRYDRHLFTMRKKLKDSLSRKSQTQVQTEEASKRQRILADILNKEVQKSQHMTELEERKSLERRVKAHQRDARIESARLRHYYDEFHEDMSRRLQKRNFGEEQILKKLFDDALTMQKDQVLTLKKQLRERQHKDAHHHQIYLDALENFYQNQFSLLAKSLAVEKLDMETRAKAQQRALDMMKREYRKKLESEIRRMQDNILRNNEDIHFREMDADRVRSDLEERFNAIFCS